MHTIMNYVSIYSFLLIGLVASCTGCQKEPTQLSSAQQNGCLMVTQTTKQLVSERQPSQLDLETVIVDGKSVQVGTTKKSAYTYDEQGRILTEYNQYAGSEANYVRANADSVFYQYSASEVLIRTVSFSDNTKNERSYTVALNKQGLAEKQPLDFKATYDNSGYLMSLVNDDYQLAATIDKGDIIEQTMPGYDATPSHTFRYTYDLDKPGLLAIPTFYGKPSRHLPAGYTIQQNGPFDVYPNVYQVRYTYTFNELGLVKRQIFQGKNGEKAYLYGGGSPIKVTDFTYTCSQ